MATFTPRKGLEQKLAAMLRGPVDDVAKQVEDRAKELAPATKVWTTVGDDRVRHQHRKVNGTELPANLRFKLSSYEWDREHRGVGPFTYLLGPRDETGRALIAIINCRCHLQKGSGVADGISRDPATVAGSTVTATVVSDSEWAVEAEYGAVYPQLGAVPGVRYMGRAVEQVAAASR